jgi:rsbT co-antagonist protein RsbR
MEKIAKKEENTMGMADETLQAENERLKQHIAELQAELDRTIAECKQKEQDWLVYRAMLNNAPDAIGVATLDGVLTNANPTFKQMLGYGEDLIGMRIPQLHPDFMQERLATSIPTMMEKGAWQGELSYQRADGSIFPALASTFAVYDEQGNQQAIAAIIRDMTDRKQMEDHLHESQQQLEFILEGSGDGAWDWKLDTNEVMLSDRYREMLGYELDELPNSVESWIDNIHPEDLPAVNQHLQDYLAGRSSVYGIEHRIQRKDGEWCWMLTRGKVITRDDAGNPLRMTGTISDIHERKQQEDALRAFKALVETSPDGIGIATMDGTITYANPALQTLTGYGKAVIGKQFLSLYPADQQAAVANTAQQVTTEGFWQGTLTLQRADAQQVPVQLSSYILHDAQGRPVSLTGIFRDLTEQRKAEEERAQLQEQVISAQREALRELSTPLLPLDQNVLAMPLVGTIDSNRSQQVMETLLEGISAHQADTVIVDITGVKVIDTQVAQGIVRTAQAVRLLGAQVVLTGIQPQIAQTLVHLGADMHGIVTRSTLQSGIAYALHGAGVSNGNGKMHGNGKVNANGKVNGNGKVKTDLV